jgi:hypothetical protein
MNELQRSAFSFPAAYVSQIGQEHFRMLHDRSHRPSIGLSINR